MHIVPLQKGHDRGAFDCGVESLNAFLRQHARRNAESGLSTTYVLLDASSPRICAYYTIASGEFDRWLLPGDVGTTLPKHPVPIVRLCQLATDLTYRGQGLGEIMLIDAMKRAAMVSTQLGVHAVEVEALSEHARLYYLRYGFSPLKDDPNHLYLLIASITPLL